MDQDSFRDLVSPIIETLGSFIKSVTESGLIKLLTELFVFVFSFFF